MPKLLIIAPSGELITDKGRKEVEDRGVAAFRSWLTGAGISAARVKTPDFTREKLFETEDNITENNVNKHETGKQESTVQEEKT